METHPIYIKLRSTNSWFRITDDHSFTEVKTLGNYYSITEFSDDILPMRNHILDLIEGEGTEKISESEFSEHLDQLKTQFILKEF